MIPATRARLCAALERETGRAWAPLGDIVTTIDPPSRADVDRRFGRGWTRPGQSVPWRDLGPFTGRNWPERLAAEVARVLSETSTTGEKP